MNLDDKVKIWIERLKEAVGCDPDYGDPIYCLQDVETIIKAMEKEVL